MSKLTITYVGISQTRRRSESAYIRQVGLHDNVIMYTSTRLHSLRATLVG